MGPWGSGANAGARPHFSIALTSAELHAHRRRPSKRGLGVPRRGEERPESSRFTARGAWLREAAAGAAVVAQPLSANQQRLVLPTARTYSSRPGGRESSRSGPRSPYSCRAEASALPAAREPALCGSPSLSWVTLTSASDRPFCLPPQDPPVMRENVPASGPLIAPAEPLSRGTGVRRSRGRRGHRGDHRSSCHAQRKRRREGRASSPSVGQQRRFRGASPQAPVIPEESGVSRRTRRSSGVLAWPGRFCAAACWEEPLAGVKVRAENTASCSARAEQGRTPRTRSTRRASERRAGHSSAREPARTGGGPRAQSGLLGRYLKLGNT